MASQAITLVGTRKKAARRRQTQSATLTAKQYTRLTVIHQIEMAFRPGARLAAATGTILGATVPTSTFVLIHSAYGVVLNPWLWALVVGGLLYSAPTVFSWALDAFGSKVKAAGFCVLMEGILTFAHIAALTYLALAVLVFINAVSAACALQVRKEVKCDD